MTYVAITSYMDERERADFDTRLLASPDGPRRPDAGVEQLWGVMGRPGVAPGIRPPAAGAPAPQRPRVPSPSGRKVGEAP